MNLRNLFLFTLLILCSLITSGVYSQQHKLNRHWLKERREVGETTVLLNNEQGVVPLRELAENRIVSVGFDSRLSPVFDRVLNFHARVASVGGKEYLGKSGRMEDLSYDLKFYNTVIVQVSADQLKDSQVLDFIRDNQKSKTIVVAAFGDKKALAALNDLQVPIIWSSKYSAESVDYVAQAIFGGLPLVSKLPFDASERYRKGAGFQTQVTRLTYTVPEELGIKAEDLQKPVDEIIAEAIAQRATPSAVLMVIKDGKVIMNQAFGSHTYEGTRPTKTTDIYDLASVTKITATTAAVMRLFEEKKLNLDTPVSAYIPEAWNTNKRNIPVRQVMLHEAGFVPFIPFFKDIKPEDFSRDSSAAYSIAASQNYYFRKDFFKDVMWPLMLNSALRDTGKYVYSDLSMYFMKEVVEGISAEHMEDYVQQNFYKPLGMQRAGYHPLYRFTREQIVPTEVDTLFRNTLLQGYVHDPGASMVGGVSGHAGLFGSAYDLAIFYQMLLNGGTYGGVRYFKPETVEMFSSRQSRTSRRGLGFDRSDVKIEYPSKLASANTFGHTGYTGIRLWVDKDVNLIYILLTNRVHPVTSNKLNDLNISSRLMDAIYNVISKVK